jgi:hypothetical protein
MAAVSLIAASWGLFADRVGFAPDSTLCLNGGCSLDQIDSALSAAGPSAKLDSVVLTDPADPTAWCAYAEALAERGDTEKAESAFGRATDLGRGMAAVWVRAANFYFTHDRAEKGFAAAHHIVAQTDLFDQIVFSYLTASGRPASKLLGSAIPVEPRGARSWLTWIEVHGSQEDLRETWAWMHTHGLGDQRSAVGLTQTLWGRKSYRVAQEIWADWLGSGRGDYLQPQLLTDRRFRDEPNGGPFSWNLEAPPGVALDRKDGLEVRFLGTDNINLSNPRQFALLAPGRYRFTAEIEGAGLNTDQGPYFRIVDTIDAKRLSVETPQVHGDAARSWTTVEFSAGAGTEVVEVQLRRNPSLRFDNLIAGSLHIFTVSLSAVRLESGPAGRERSLGWFKPTF